MVKSGIRTACLLLVVATTLLVTTRVWAQAPAEATVPGPGCPGSVAGY